MLVPASASSRALLWLRVSIVVMVLALVGARWSNTTGFTCLISFGSEFEASRLPSIKTQPLAVASGSGYDGQFYAQIAVTPNVTSPDLKTALDQPAYRSRRILLPLIAHGLGFGDPWWVLQIFALLNTAAWLAVAWLWWRQLATSTARGTWVWLACVLSLGALDSVRLSLTDLPMVLALILAVSALRQNRYGLAAIAFIAAGFVRETALIAFQPLGPKNTASAHRQAWLRAGLCAVPIALWCLWLVFLFPDTSHGVQGNLDWPGFAFARHVWTCLQELRNGNFDSRYAFGLIGALGMTYQSLFLIRRWRDTDPWARIGLSFAVLFWFLGDFVWHGYWAAARASLPMTFAFNYQLLKENRFTLKFAAGNLFTLHGLIRLLPF